MGGAWFLSFCSVRVVFWGRVWRPLYQVAASMVPLRVYSCSVLDVFRGPSRGMFVLVLPCNWGGSGPSRGLVYQLQISWMVCRRVEFRWSLNPLGCTVFSLDIQ